MTKYISKCCNAEIKEITNAGGVVYYTQCLKCKNIYKGALTFETATPEQKKELIRECPCKRSVCCGAPSIYQDLFFCSKCGDEYKKGECIIADLAIDLDKLIEAAKLEERKRIEEALSNTPEGSCFYCTRKRECRNPHDILTLDQVRSIINPK